MDNISYQDLESMMQRVIRQELDGHCQTQCPLLEAEITHEQHKQHHVIISRVVKDGRYMRRAFIAGILVTVTGGVLGLLWAFLQNKIGFLPIKG